MTTTEPTLRRKFVYIDLAGNSNKFWNIEWWDGLNVIKVTYGRTGTAGGVKTHNGVSLAEANKKIYEKLKKGYEELHLHMVSAAPSGAIVLSRNYKKEVDAATRDILATAGIAIAKFLDTAVDMLSADQVAKAKALLTDIQNLHLNGVYCGFAIQKYYGLIPTKLPARMTAITVVANFVADFQAQWDRLDQLEAAIAAYTPTVTGALPPTAFDNLAAQFEWLDPTDPEWKTINTDIQRCGTRRIKNIYKVAIQSERARYEACEKGKSKVLQLYHGTRAANLAHILKDGIKISRAAASGMFGAGLYFASEIVKANAYIGSADSGAYYMLVSHVKVGERCQMAHSDSSLRQPPRGYDSVWGVKGKTQSWSNALQNHEFVVYDEDQATVRYIVEM